MVRWFGYLTESFSLFGSFLLIIGYSYSSIVLYHHSFAPVPFILSCLLLFYLTFLLRLDNDVKDLDKDRIAFPNRPIPRGDLGKAEVTQTLRFLKYFLLIYFLVMFVFFSYKTKLLLILTGGYLWLILHHFYLKNWISDHLLVKGILHTGLLFPLTLLLISLSQPQSVFSIPSWCYATLLFGAFFTWNICRQLNPYTHPITLYYIHYYGFGVTYIIAAMTLGISAIGAWGLGVSYLLWPCEGGVLFFLTLLFFNPTRFPIVNIAASASLIIHAWAGLWKGIYLALYS